MPTHARKMPRAQAESLDRLLSETSGVNIETQHSSQHIIYVVYIYPSKFNDWMAFVKDKGPNYEKGDSTLIKRLDRVPLSETGLYRVLADGTIQSYSLTANNGAPHAADVAAELREGYDRIMADHWPLQLKVAHHEGSRVWFQGPHEVFDLVRTNYEYSGTSTFSLMAIAPPVLADAFEAVLKKYPGFLKSLSKKENEHRFSSLVR